MTPTLPSILEGLQSAEGPSEIYEDRRHQDTYGGNNPLNRQHAFWDGHRSVRLVEDNFGLATTAYSYALGYRELLEAAERIALLWNLHLGETNEQLRARVSALQAKQEQS